MCRNLPLALVTALGLLAPARIARAQEPRKDVPPPPPAPAGRPAGPQDVLKPPIRPEPARPSAPPSPVLAPPTGPTPVMLDFLAKPTAQVVRTLAERTGGMIDASNASDARWNEPITLTSAAPVPFWEAVDRLTAAADLTRSVAPSGPPPRAMTTVRLQSRFGPPGSTAADEGLVTYVGPFRVGPVAVHEHFGRTFLRPEGPSPAVAAGDAPPAPFYAEIPLVAEPNLLAIQAGPPRWSEAVDDAGQSLLAPRPGETPAPRSSGRPGPPPTVWAPLVRAPGPSRTLARLRGALPLEVARRPTAPTLVVPLAGSVGKTFRDGDLSVTVREAGAGPPGRAPVKLAARLEGPRGEADAKFPGLVAARLRSIALDQVELADADGKPVRATGYPTGTGHQDDREVVIEFRLASPANLAPSPPTHLRLYRPEWVAWDLPLDFRDVPLP